ncbi:MAG: recombinase-like helix-turn-helix domain-containing protein [Candidatus Competibacteraceae bacterium]
MGSPTPHNGAQKAAQTHRLRAAEYRTRVIPLLNQLQAEGITSLKGLARVLNQRGIPTARGGQWYARTVKNVLETRSSFRRDDTNRVLEVATKITYCF